MKTLTYIIIIIFLLVSNIYSQWIETETPYLNGITDICFINTNTGFASTAEISNSNKNYFLKTTNKGLNWVYVFEIPSGDSRSSIDFINELTGFFSQHYELRKTTNGGVNWFGTYQYGQFNTYPRVRFGDANTGYFAFSKFYTGVAGSGGIYLYRTTNGGNNWDITSINGYFTFRNSRISDISVSKSDPNLVAICGYQIINDEYNSIYYSSDNGFATGNESDNSIEIGARFDRITISPLNNDIFLLSNKGIYKENSNVLSFTETDSYEQIGINIDNNGKGYAISNGSKIYKTSNNGINWTLETTYSGSQFNDSRVINFNDIVYSGTRNGKIVSRTLLTNLYTYYDNQSSSGSIIFDNVSYSTPSQTNLRGGNSIFSSSSILNSGQSNERIFYKWENYYMYSSRLSTFFDNAGNSYANYYKTKQISNISSSIAKSIQTKSIRDTTLNGKTATHTIHESIGGIFYSKSTNFGATYQTEEVVNLSENSAATDGNKNAYLTVMRSYGGQYPITISDVDRNVAVVWEKYNSTTQMVEIKFAHRVLNIPQTGYEWKTYRDNSGNEYLTSFAASSGFESKPKCFVAVSPGQTQDGPFLIIVPHLRPNGSQNKIFTSVRYNSQSQDYELENGFIQDLAVTGPFNYYSSYIVHFAYLKDDKVAYRREEFGYYNGNIYRGTSPLPEVNNNISSGDGGFTSRYTPDISLMGGVPVITYAASYDAWRTIQYEDQSTGSIQVNRHPIVKVQKTPTGWSQFVIYNSGNNQSKPDIEGSTSTLSYILNYSIGNGSFKKIVNIPGYPGSMCQPNIFSGTDSRLINNSYTGSFGSNLSLLTLSPQSGLYKLDKQNFVITNITAQDSYDIDNLDGVVDLDTVSYSFKVGPIYTQSFFEYYYEVDGVGVIGPSLEDQVIGGIEFNENLKSYPFLLNESQALLIGSNASYVKDNSHYSISEIPYTVKLYNKTTGLLHRTLFQDTIRDQDSIETESLRGFYITDIPNGVDSFFVKLEVDDEFDNADYFINPIYEDENEEQDNMNEKKMAVIFENTTPQIHDNNIPVKYDLLQNYPNPFNPTTNLEFGISELGFVTLKVYDILGKEVKTLVNEIKPAGTYSVLFDGSNLASGVYFYRIEAGEFRDIRRMVLIK